MYIDETKKIHEVIQDYFDGIYNGDVDKLRSIFTPDTHLYGEVKGDEYHKSLDEYLEIVAGRTSVKDSGGDFKTDILGVEVLGSIAIVKVRLQMLGFNYYDFLSLSVMGGGWKIINKVFTHVA